MLRAIQGGGVLLVLSVFFAYMLAPVDAGLRCRVRIGRRKRPLPRAVSLTLLYAVLFVAGTLTWRLAGNRMTTDGVLLIDSRENRTQGQNREAARARLVALLQQAARRPKTRRPTRPRKAAKETRLASKKRRSEVKSLRGRGPRSDD